MLYIFCCLVAIAVVFGLTLLFYWNVNHGLSNRSLHQQTWRYLIAAVLAVLPVMMTQQSPLRPDFLMAWLTGLLWLGTYPLLYHLTNRHTSPDYDNRFDPAFGLYMCGLFTAAALLCSPFPLAAFLLGVVEFALFMIPLAQIIWYLLYHTCIDANGVQVLQETNINESLEFFKSFSLPRSLAMIVGTLAALLLCIMANIASRQPLSNTGSLAFCSVYIVAMAWLMFRPHGGYLWRTGIMDLVASLRNYVINNTLYRTEMENRIRDLEVEPLAPAPDKPSTIIMVIGESACRDYMAVYHPEMAPDNTPWLSAMAKNDPHTVVFTHPYSCAIQTVPSLEKALTEFNQYNQKPFYKSVSIVDIARRLGFATHWYSNQGHLGSTETPITLVAESADVAKWTRQEVGRVQYDENLLKYLDEVDPTKNNFVVIHLKGSHFPFNSRYPESFAPKHERSVAGNVANYKESIAYTDHVLRSIYEYGRDKLNLQAMVYFSDHAQEPARSRKPNFSSFQMTRIPLFVWMSDDYVARHPDRYNALRANKDRYFTNDLVYNLMCGIFDIRSQHYDATESIASAQYRFRREDLITLDGQRRIADDNDEDNKSSNMI